MAWLLSTVVYPSEQALLGLSGKHTNRGHWWGLISLCERETARAGTGVGAGISHSYEDQEFEVKTFFESIHFFV